MTVATGRARADVVGSLLRPDYLRDARKAAAHGTLAAEDLRAVEDRAVREAIALQESAGMRYPDDGKGDGRADDGEHVRGAVPCDDVG
jgi:5-methyltetrahydropteroyltriglutamate--homocysteine methyltransferase